MTSSFIHTYIYIYNIFMSSKSVYVMLKTAATKERRDAGVFCADCSTTLSDQVRSGVKVTSSFIFTSRFRELENSRLDDKGQSLENPTFVFRSVLSSLLLYGFIVSSRSIISRVHRIFTIFYGEYMYVCIYVRFFVIVVNVVVFFSL